MCVQNVNATISLFSDVRNAEVQGAQEFIRPFDIIVSKTINDNKYIGGFYIVIDIVLLSTTNEGKKEDNVVYNKQKIDVIVRLTKSSKDFQKRLSSDIDEFTIDTSNENIIKRNACVEYVGYKKIKKIDIDGIKLSPEAGTGDYIFKVLVKRPCDNEYQVQSVYNLRIE
ncbi:MAG: hypothetical protein E7260_09595 [Lachnospiraceae bacterium]|nr:hypothetical protein [Lachnospiraceae bacterium]